MKCSEVQLNSLLLKAYDKVAMGKPHVHFKTKLRYIPTDVAFNTKDGDVVVLYHEESKPELKFSRSLAEWEDTVDGTKRFELAKCD